MVTFGEFGWITLGKLPRSESTLHREQRQYTNAIQLAHMCRYGRGLVLVAVMI